MQVAKGLGGIQSLEGGHTGAGAGNTFCASFGEEVGDFILKDALNRFLQGQEASSPQVLHGNRLVPNPLLYR